MPCELFTTPSTLCPHISSAGFLVMLSPRNLCLSYQNQLVILVQCDVINSAQQWTWLGGGRLIHTQSSRCLWADFTSHLPVHARLVKLTNCSEAPAWSCFNTHGTFGLADTNFYLREQGSRLVIGGNMKLSEWNKYDVDSGGTPLMTSLCPETGERRQND